MEGLSTHRVIVLAAAILIAGSCGGTEVTTSPTGSPTVGSTLTATSLPPSAELDERTTAALGAIGYLAEVTPLKLADIEAGSDLRYYDVAVDRLEWQAEGSRAPGEGDVIRLAVRPYWTIAPGETIRVGVRPFGASAEAAVGIITVVTSLDGTVQRPAGDDEREPLADFVEAEAARRADGDEPDRRAALRSGIEAVRSRTTSADDDLAPRPTNQPGVTVGP